jgi:hypothetical protein
MAQRIAGDSREWQRLIARQVFSGDGIITPPSQVIAGTEAFPMPANYKRMLVDGNVWRSTSAIQPMMFISSADEWLHRRARGYNYAWGEWMLQGGNMHIWPIMAAHTSRAWQAGRHYKVGDLAVDMDVGTVPYQLVWQVATAHTSGTTFAGDRLANPSLWVLPAQDVDAVTATFNYIDKNCVTLASGGFGDAFMADTDSFRLDERLLKLGMIWQWKALKGSPYAEDMATFMDALTRASGADKPAPILIHRLPSSVMTAYPYPTPTASDWNWPLS